MSQMTRKLKYSRKVFGRQARIIRQNRLNRIASGQGTKNLRHHHTRTANDRTAVANERIDFDSFVHDGNIIAHFDYPHFSASLLPLPPSRSFPDPQKSAFRISAEGGQPTIIARGRERCKKGPPRGTAVCAVFSPRCVTESLPLGGPKVCYAVFQIGSLMPPVSLISDPGAPRIFTQHYMPKARLPQYHTNVWYAGQPDRYGIMSSDELLAARRRPLTYTQL